MSDFIFLLITSRTYFDELINEVKIMISIIDYDAGNIKSVEKAISFLESQAVITRDRDEILSSEGVILPGVG